MVGIEISGQGLQACGERGVTGEHRRIGRALGAEDATARVQPDRGPLQLVGRAVGQRQSVVVRKCLDLIVVGVDRLTTGLHVEPVRERMVECVDTTTDPVPGLEHGDVPTPGAQGQRRGQAREARADHYGTLAGGRHRPGSRGAGCQGHGRRRQSTADEETTSGQALGGGHRPSVPSDRPSGAVRRNRRQSVPSVARILPDSPTNVTVT